MASSSQGIPQVASAIMGAYAVGLGGLMHRLGSSRQRAVLGPIGYLVSFFGGAWLASSVAQAVGSQGASWDLVGGLLGILAATQIRSAARGTRERRSQLPPTDPGSRDPGWPLIPFVTLRPRLSSKKTPYVGPAITPIRYLFVAFTNALVLYWFVLSFIEQNPGTRPSATGAAGLLSAVLLVLAGIAFVLGRRFEGRVVTSDASQVLASYRTVLFLRIASAEAAPLLAFIGTFLTRASWLYPTGLALSMPAWVALAPSARNLKRVDEERRAAGRPGSLYEQLVPPPSSQAWGPPDV